MFKISFWPCIHLRSHWKVMVLGLAVHHWRRNLGGLGTQSTKNSPFACLDGLSMGLRARNSVDTSSSLGAEETSMAKNMAKIAILGQSLVYNLLVQGKTIKQSDLY
jgi:hypothetical protein